MSNGPNQNVYIGPGFCTPASAENFFKRSFSPPISGRPLRTTASEPNVWVATPTGHDFFLGTVTAGRETLTSLPKAAQGGMQVQRRGTRPGRGSKTSQKPGL